MSFVRVGYIFLLFSVLMDAGLELDLEGDLRLRVLLDEDLDEERAVGLTRQSRPVSLSLVGLILEEEGRVHGFLHLHLALSRALVLLVEISGTSERGAGVDLAGETLAGKVRVQGGDEGALQARPAPAQDDDPARHLHAIILESLLSPLLLLLGVASECAPGH